MNGFHLRGATSLLVTVALLGCPGERKTESSSASSNAPLFANESDVLRANVTVAPALEELARDRGQPASMRYAALRRLEEIGSPRAVVVSEHLILDPSRNRDAEFLRKNCVALLARSKSADGARALERVKKASIEVAILAARLNGEK